MAPIRITPRFALSRYLLSRTSGCSSARFCSDVLKRIQRIVDLVPQRARHVLEELVVLLQLGQHAGHAARKVADFVAGVHRALKCIRAQPTAWIDRGARFASELPNPPRQPPGEGDQHDEHHQQAHQRQHDHLFERGPLEGQNVGDVLLDHDAAEDRVARHDRVRGHDDFLVIHATAQRDRIAAQRRLDHLVDDGRGVFRQVDVIPTLPHHEPVHDRTNHVEPATRGRRPAGVDGFAILAHGEAAGFGANAVLRVDDENARAGIAEPLNDVQHLWRAQARRD